MKISVITPTIRPKGLEIVYNSLADQTFQDFEWLVDVGFPARGNDLNASYNRLIRRAKGELIVSLQDFIRAPSNLLDKAWEAYQKHPDTFWTVPVGKTKDFKNIYFDWREAGSADWQRWEIDCGFVSKEALYKIGGFDEGLDELTWSGDNVVVGWKAQSLGYKFDVLRDVRCVAYDHDATMPHPFRGPQQRLEAINERINEWNINKPMFLS